MEVKVLGPGCPKCEETERLVREAVSELGIEATVEKIKDFNEFAKYGVFSTPAVVVNGQAKCVGKVPTKDEIKNWLAG